MWGEGETSQYAAEFTAYISVLSLSRVLVLRDTTRYSEVLTQSLYDVPNHMFTDYLTLPADLSMQYALRIAGKEIKPLGFTSIVFVLNPEATLVMLQALE